MDRPTSRLNPAAFLPWLFRLLLAEGGLSNARLRAMGERGVTFATKGGRELTLPGVAFLRRFVDHVLPKGFTRIRHYGLLAHRDRGERPPGVRNRRRGAA